MLCNDNNFMCVFLPLLCYTTAPQTITSYCNYDATIFPLINHFLSPRCEEIELFRRNIALRGRFLNRYRFISRIFYTGAGKCLNSLDTSLSRVRRDVRAKAYLGPRFFTFTILRIHPTHRRESYQRLPESPYAKYLVPFEERQG